MLAKDKHDNYSLSKPKVIVIKEVRWTDLWVRAFYCSDLFYTDKLPTQWPNPLSERNYSTVHNITSFIKELNVPPVEKGNTYPRARRTHAFAMMQTHENSCRQTHASLSPHPSSTLRTLSVC